MGEEGLKQSTRPPRPLPQTTAMLGGGLEEKDGVDDSLDARYLLLSTMFSIFMGLSCLDWIGLVKTLSRERLKTRGDKDSRQDEAL